jgi:serine/threonine-protein kinase
MFQAVTMIGVRLGSWVIEEEIGRGGMGAVYRARRTPDADPGPEQAAIKVLAAELAVEVGFQQRFQREIEILRQLEHPVIVALLDSGNDKGRFWFAMEYVAGPSFEELRDGRGRVPWADVLEMAWQIAPALKHAHDRGIIHRDLKPSNLLRVQESGSVKLTDFGIASLFASPHLTVTGGVIGTPEYLSPEQAAGKPVTRKSDLYSLGVVLYTLVTGTTPFVGNQIDLLHKHRFGQFDRPGKIVADLPPDFEDIICSLLEKDPANRPPDGGVLFRKLDSLKRKLVRQAASDTPGIVPSQPTAPGPREGMATMVSRMVRQELMEQNQPGPVGRVINKPIVLVTLFVLCIATLVWTFWPSGPETLYSKGVALMASDRPGDWDRAWEDYLDPLEEKYPDHPHKEEVAQLRQEYADRVAEQTAAVAARSKKEISEPQWFFERGQRLRRCGQEKQARQVWQALVDGYSDVPAAKPWVRRASDELKKTVVAAQEAPQVLRQALERAKKLEEEGKKKEASQIRKSLAELYRDDPRSLALIEGK